MIIPDIEQQNFQPPILRGNRGTLLLDSTCIQVLRFFFLEKKSQDLSGNRRCESVGSEM